MATGSVRPVEVDLEPELAALVDGGEWEPAIGTSGASTWHVDLDGERLALVVKAGVGAATNELVDGEAKRWAWLEGRLSDLPSIVDRLPLPRLVGSQPAADGRPAAFVTEAAVGVSELHWFIDPRRAADLLGTSLRAVHELPVDGCPFDAQPGTLLARAAERVAAGVIDQRTFGAAHQRYTPAELIGYAEAMLPDDPVADDRVVVHGDWSVGNMIARPDTGALTGIVDWAGLGVGDRHFDLAAAARSLVAYFGGEVLPTFLDSYGFAEPDALRLEFYALIDQLR